MVTYSGISGLNASLVRKALTGSLFAAPFSAAALTRSNLFATGGALAVLPTGWGDGGITTDEGIRFARETESEDITGWQYREPVRSELTADSETLQVDFLETKKLTIELYTGADLTGATSTNGAIAIEKPALPPSRYFRLLALAVDSIEGLELYIARFYPRCKVTGWAEQAFAKEGALQWGMTFTTYTDPVLGYSKSDMVSGPALQTLDTAMGLTVT